MWARSSGSVVVLITCTILSGCWTQKEQQRAPEEPGVAGGEPVKDQAPLQEQELTPELARAALVEFVRRDPKAFEGIFDPKVASAEETEKRLGWFTISVTRKSFGLNLTPRPESLPACTIDYRGKFTFRDGRWQAEVVDVSYAYTRHMDKDYLKK